MTILRIICLVIVTVGAVLISRVLTAAHNDWESGAWVFVLVFWIDGYADIRSRIDKP